MKTRAKKRRQRVCLVWIYDGGFFYRVVLSVTYIVVSSRNNVNKRAYETCMLRRE